MNEASDTILREFPHLEVEQIHLDEESKLTDAWRDKCFGLEHEKEIQWLEASEAHFRRALGKIYMDIEKSFAEA